MKQYRLIGFDNKVGALADSTSEIEGGEIGSGQSLTAAFEIQPNFEAGANVFSNKYAEVKLHHRLPMLEIQQQVTESFPYNPIPYKDVDPIFRFASSVIMFGSVLKSSSFAKDIGWGAVLFHASEAANPTDINQAQFVELVYKAKEFNTKKKKKNRN